MRWERPDTLAASYVKSVFVTSFVLHCLKHVIDLAQIEQTTQHAVRFLLNEMEQNGLWRFFGRNSHIHFDIDVVCCVLASLKEWGVKLDYDAQASLLLKYRNDQGLFYTWILDVDPPFEKEDNNIDWVVNANALFFYSLLCQSLPEVEQYLIEVVETNTFQQRSPYYDPTFAFIYCVTRAYADGCNSRLCSAIARIKDYLLYSKSMDKLYGDPAQNVLAIAGLLNCGGKTTDSKQAMEHLVSMQGEDGGWPIGIFHTGGPYTEYGVAYGSRELTTAIALESMSKYLKANSVNVLWKELRIC